MIKNSKHFIFYNNATRKEACEDDKKSKKFRGKGIDEGKKICYIKRAY
jgi:hypothetical protein